MKRVKNNSKVAMLAAMFAMVFTFNACSGDDGNDGANGARGAPGETCDLKPSADGSSAKITCGEETFNIVNGSGGDDGKSCGVEEDGAYFVMECDGKEEARWAKAMCGSTAYDPAGSKFCDTREGRLYKYVTIGTGATAQTWMAENLNYYIAGGKCYNNSTANCAKYGRLYDWETANNVCPLGWHLPSDAEWTVLAKFAGGTGTNGETGTVGTKLKATSGWNDHETYGNGTDDFGFSALPGGYGGSGGGFYDVGNNGRWWSASDDGNSSSAYIRLMYYNYENAIYYDSDKSNLHSVRCLKD